MKNDLKYWSFLLLAVLFFLFIELLAPEPLNWNVTYSPKDKNPYGGFIIGDLLSEIFAERSIQNVNQTLFELKDTIHGEQNILIITSSFKPDKLDAGVLLSKVDKGAHAFISANRFTGFFADTLTLGTADYFFSKEILGNLDRKDSAGLKIINPWLDHEDLFYYQRNNIPYYFNKFDSAKTTIIAENDLGLPVTIRIRLGKGYLILNSTPLAFTNNYLLYKDNNDFVEANLSFLPQRDVIWTEYYHLGRAELTTPLRFILTNISLKWAYYITIASLFLFIIFEAKRKQRKIPIIKPLTNTTLEFVKTLGNLYFQKGNHKDIALKNIIYFKEKIYSTYNVRVLANDAELESFLAHKFGTTEQKVHDLFSYFEKIQSQQTVNSGELLELIKRIEKIENGKR